MLQVTVISTDGTRYPIAWFAISETELANSFANEKRLKWSAVLVHEVTSVVIRGICIPRIHFDVNGD